MYLFLQLAVLYYVVKKLSTRHILHHHKDISRCGNDLKDENCERSLNAKRLHLECILEHRGLRQISLKKGAESIGFYHITLRPSENLFTHMFCFANVIMIIGIWNNAMISAEEV